MRAALAKSVAEIEEAGFGYIKVEFEANLYRSQDSPCTACNREGRIDCDNCSGTGFLQARPDEDAVECTSCMGYGRRGCDPCHGRGVVSGRFTNVGDCQRFIEGRLSTDCRAALNYIYFYRDGSVDSELTFTLPIGKVEFVIEVMQAWNALAAEIGNGVDVDGAGMHTALLLTESRGSYPTSHTMPRPNINNFTTQVNRLMPALFFLASADHRSRSYSFREPRVSSETKYSAIYTKYNTVLEYRVFETCYDRPETFFEYVQVMAQTLKFYKDPTLQVSRLGKMYAFPSSDGRTNRYFCTPENLKIINAQIKWLKPGDKSYKELKSERGVTGTVKDLLMKRKIREAELKQTYEQHKKVYDSVVKQPLTPSEQRTVDRNVIAGYRYDAAIARARNQTPLAPMRHFIKSNVETPSVHVTVEV